MGTVLAAVGALDQAVAVEHGVDGALSGYADLAGLPAHQQFPDFAGVYEAKPHAVAPELISNESCIKRGS